MTKAFILKLFYNKLKSVHNTVFFSSQKRKKKMHGGRILNDQKKSKNLCLEFKFPFHTVHTRANLGLISMKYHENFVDLEL
jgi:hypothetical protein